MQGRKEFLDVPFVVASMTKKKEGATGRPRECAEFPASSLYKTKKKCVSYTHAQKDGHCGN
jgi:hypothetical protein